MTIFCCTRRRNVFGKQSHALRADTKALPKLHNIKMDNVEFSIIDNEACQYSDLKDGPNGRWREFEFHLLPTLTNTLPYLFVQYIYGQSIYTDRQIDRHVSRDDC